MKELRILHLTLSKKPFEEMKRKFEIGQKLFFVDEYCKVGSTYTFESTIIEIGRKYLKVEHFSRKIDINTLEIQGWTTIKCFESKEAYEQNEARKQLINELKYTVDFRRYSLSQLEQIKELINSFKDGTKNIAPDSR